jgi:lipoprotein-releasing system ATP-binding protein
LDQHTADGVFDLLLDLARTQGSAVVVVTHDRRLAQRCGQQWALASGQLGLI